MTASPGISGSRTKTSRWAPAARSLPAQLPTGQPISLTLTRSGALTRSRSGPTSASGAPSPTPTAMATRGCRHATRTSPPVAYDTEHFYRARASSSTRPAPALPAPIGPGHRPSRPTPRSTSRPGGLLLPAFAPKAIAEWEPCHTGGLCSAACSTGSTAGTCSTAPSTYAQHIPVDVIARMLGLPPGETGRRIPAVRPRRDRVRVPPRRRAGRSIRGPSGGDVHRRRRRGPPRRPS